MLMLHSRSVLQIAALALLGFSAGHARGASPAPGVGVAVVDFAYVDTSGEPDDQTAAHCRRLNALMAALRRDVAADGRFRLVPIVLEPAPCLDDRQPGPDVLRVAAEAGAKLLVIGGIHKRSTL